MHVFKNHIKEKMIRSFESKYPDLLMYLDNPYLSELVDGIFDIVSEEIAEIKNETVSKRDFQRKF
ncbi:hypothetical protein [Paenibacillus alvei]|uniref:Uncharacterized protein n=1 Tax=Paenibacillus alvei TaxID=44250 RepID=A0A383REF1_PAEAL|nr:hypothetical protein [Paenibacillus alvei]SYX85051.1 conserved protein of unknown function [Paenibacillus alvei]